MDNEKNFAVVESLIERLTYTHKDLTDRGPALAALARIRQQVQEQDAEIARLRAQVSAHEAWLARDSQHAEVTRLRGLVAEAASDIAAFQDAHFPNLPGYRNSRALMSAIHARLTAEAKPEARGESPATNALFQMGPAKCDSLGVLRGAGEYHGIPAESPEPPAECAHGKRIGYCADCLIGPLKESRPACPTCGQEIGEEK